MNFQEDGQSDLGSLLATVGGIVANLSVRILNMILNINIVSTIILKLYFRVTESI